MVKIFKLNLGRCRVKITRSQLIKMITEQVTDVTQSKQEEIDAALDQYLDDEGGAASKEGTEEVIKTAMPGLDAEKYLASKSDKYVQLGDQGGDGDYAKADDIPGMTTEIRNLIIQEMNKLTLVKKPIHHDHGSNLDFMGKPDHEGKMAHKQLKRTAAMAQSLCHRLEDKEDIQLPAWVQSKITKAADYIQSVFNYLDDDLH